MPIPTSREGHATRRKGAAAAARSRGVVLVITLLAILLLAALVLWVVNLGQQVNRRASAQHAADAAARAGSGWVARSLNTVASNNKQMARYVALINVLDPMPQAAEFTRRETRYFRDRLELQMAVGLRLSPQTLHQVVVGELRGMALDFEDQLGELRTAERMLAGADIPRITTCRLGGRLWQSLHALSELNEAIMENLAEVAQLSAVAGGEANLPADGDDAVYLLPMHLIDVPHRLGIFGDFEWPVRQGMISPISDHRVVRRGPWDAVYGWRDALGRREGGRLVAGQSRALGGATGRGAPIGQGAVDDARLTGARFTAEAYRTYGPQEWMLRRLDCYAADRLPHTRFDWYQRRLTDHVMRYAFPWELDAAYANTHGLEVRRHDACTTSGRISNRGYTAHIVDPVWRPDYDGIREDVAQGELEVKETAFIVLELKSRYPRGHERFMSPGSFKLVDEQHPQSPRLVIRPGWQDPARWGLQRINDDLWIDPWSYQVAFDRSIGIEPVTEPATDADGDEAESIVPQRVYRMDHFIFMGANVGSEADVHNPYAGVGPFERRHRPRDRLDLDHLRLPGVAVALPRIRWRRLPMRRLTPPPLVSFQLPGPSAHGESEFACPPPPAPMLLLYDEHGLVEDAGGDPYDPVQRTRYFSHLAVVRRSDEPQAWPERFRGGRPVPHMLAIAHAKVFNQHSWDLWTPMWRAQLQPVTAYDQWPEALTEGSPGAAALQIEDLHNYLLHSGDLAEEMLRH